jgi:hypothetical protein
MSLLNDYQAVVLDITQWNADAVELAHQLRKMYDRRDAILKAARDLKMPTRTISYEMAWPIEMAPVDAIAEQPAEPQPALEAVQLSATVVETQPEALPGYVAPVLADDEILF